MARLNPIQLEIHFNETLRLIISAPSERVQLHLILTFLKRVEGNEQEYESYIVQLLQKLPDLKNPLLYAGLNPKYFKEIVLLLDRCLLEIDQFQHQDEIHQKIFEYKTALTQLYKWVGEQVASEVLEDSISIYRGKEHAEFTKGVLVPVVERSGKIKSGRLRRLSLEIIGTSKHKFEIKPTFGVIGAEVGTFLQEASSAAGNLLRESRKGRNKQWIGTAKFELSHAWHSGNSANLALAGAFYCEMLKAEEVQEYFRLNPSICITGDIDEQGMVLEVEESSLIFKVEAAFFSWVQVLVVPASQLSRTLTEIEKLQEDFPNRHLPVFGVSHLKELFFDRRLTIYHKTGAIQHNLKKAWRKRFSVATISVVIALLLIIGRLVYGPVDKNPAAIEFAGSKMLVKNADGATLFEKMVEPEAVQAANSNEYSLNNFAELIDLNGDGLKEIVFFRRFINNRVFSLNALNARGETLWEATYETMYKYKYHTYVDSEVFLINSLAVVDIEEDGVEELLVIANHELYFPSRIILIDPLTGKSNKQWLHCGNISDLEFIDLNGDSIKEIVFSGVNNADKRAFLGVLDVNSKEGQICTSERYFAEDMPIVNPIAYVQFPTTLLLQKLYSEGFMEALPRVDRLYLRNNKDILVQVRETVLGSRKADVLYFFDTLLNLISIAPTNSYDFLAKELYEKGQTEVLADGEYLETYKDSLYWWDGEQLVRQRTLVKQ